MINILKILKSRKFIYAALGILSGLCIWGISLWSVVLFPAAAPSVVALFHGILPYIAGIIAALLGVHSWMDFKTIAATNTNLSSSTSQIEIVKKNLGEWHKAAYAANGTPFDYSPDGEDMEDKPNG